MDSDMEYKEFGKESAYGEKTAWWVDVFGALSVRRRVVHGARKIY